MIRAQVDETRVAVADEIDHIDRTLAVAVHGGRRCEGVAADPSLLLVFGAVVWFLRRSDEPPFAVDPRGLRLAGQAVWAAVTLGTLGLFLAAARVSPERRATFAVIAWALGESTAIYGGLFWLLLGDPQWYVYGVGCLLLTYFIFPIRGTR